MLVRDKIEIECFWSTLTFYRKMQPFSKLSNAEKEMIIRVFDETFKGLWEYCEKYRNSNNS